MMKRIDKLPDDRRKTSSTIVALVLATLLNLTGCIRIIPVYRVGEKHEAAELGKVLLKLMPEAESLLHDERKCADELKIDMDEAGDQVGNAGGRKKFNSYIDRLVIIRDRRAQIQQTVLQGVYDSPMVFSIQHDAVLVLGDEISRTQTWITVAQNLVLRAGMGRTKEFPELGILTLQLNGYLSSPPEEPLFKQWKYLQEEYRFGRGELGP
jgi:hypothetical protein